VPGFDPNDDGIFGLSSGVDDSAVVLVPVPWEVTVTYGAGTAGAPAAILAASHQVDLHDRETGLPHAAGIAMLEIPDEVCTWNEAARRQALPIIEAGGPGPDFDLRAVATEVDAACARLGAWLRDQVDDLHSRRKLVGVVGGEHSVSFGAIQALAARHPGLGVLQIDAHADLRQAYQGLRWSHASIMDNVLREIDAVGRIVQVGVRDYCDEEAARIQQEDSRVKTFFDADLRRALLAGRSWIGLTEHIVEQLPPEVYVSLDVDGLDPALCPHTGTPVPGGLSFSELCWLLSAIVESGRQIVGFDLVEVAPDPSGVSDWDANVGARLLYKQIGFALRSRGLDDGRPY
jgi:agmatinase